MVVDVQSIQSVVAMVPLPLLDSERVQGASTAASRYFAVEKPGLDIFTLGGYQEGVEADEEGNDAGDAAADTAS